MVQGERLCLETRYQPIAVRNPGLEHQLYQRFACVHPNWVADYCERLKRGQKGYVLQAQRRVVYKKQLRDQHYQKPTGHK